MHSFQQRYPFAAVGVVLSTPRIGTKWQVVDSRLHTCVYQVL